MLNIIHEFAEMSENNKTLLLEALMRCYQETRGCAYMTGFREFAGNTNTIILHTAIESVDALLPSQNP